MEKLKSENKNLAHFHLQDCFGNKRTLICYLVDGAIRYVYFGGIMDSGTPHALSNLQCNLPIEALPGESRKQFKERLKCTINKNSVERIIREIEEVTFNEKED